MSGVVWRDRFATFVLTAVSAALFSAVVALLLLWNFVHRVPDPLTAPAYLELREQLLAQPDSQEVKERIRAIDLALREDYFRRRQFTTSGVYLLLGGVAVAVVAAKIASRLKRRLPHPVPLDSFRDPESQFARHTAWGIGGLAALLGVLIVAWGYGARTVVAPGLAPTVAVVESNKSPGAKDKVENQATQAPKPVRPSPAPSPPSPEDFRQNWPRFRGPLGSGVSATPDMPTRWDAAAGEGIVWKSPVPLPGNSSPIVWQDSVFLTGATEESREVYCFASADGALRWKWVVPAAGEAAEPTEVSEDTGYAAPTMATDGLRVFAAFANGDFGAADLQGQQVWVRHLGPLKNAYGHASSLAATPEKLIVQLDQGGKNDKMSRLLALNPATGETLWETPREVPNSWSTPLLVDHGGQSLVVTCADPWVIAYDLQDGKEVWRVKALRQDIGPSPIVAGEMVYVANEFPGISAIRLGGQGDVTATHVAWFADYGAPDTCSPLVAGDLLLALASFGTLSCYDAANGGDVLWEEEFDENFRASPGLAGQHVYLFSESGKSWVIRPTREACERVAENDLGEACMTSPAFVAGRLYIRGKEHLFCLGPKP